MRTTVRSAVAALTLATIVAGCGRGDGSEDVAVVEDLDLMQAAEAAGSARMAFRMDSTLPTFGAGDGAAPEMHMTAEGEGVVAFGSREATWSGTWAIETIPPEGSVDEYLAAPAMNLEVIEADDGGWSRFWAEGEDVPGWSEDEGSDEDGLEEGDAAEDESGDLLDPTRLDPTAFLDRLREEAGTVTVVGEEEVRGDATTRYRAEVDAELLGEDLAAPDEDGEATIDVWIDDDDRLRQVEAEGMFLELWDFGTPVDVTPPTDVSEPDDDAFLDDALPAVTGDWEPEAAGTTGDVAWTIYAAPAEVIGAATTCRTLEIDGATEDEADEDMWGDMPFPVHGSALATCGNGLAAAVSSGFVVEPVLQVLSGEGGFDLDTGSYDSALVGFVVAPEHAAGGVTIVRDGADPVALGLDEVGIAVWDGNGSPAITAIELDGGAVRCTHASTSDEVEPGFEVGVMGSGLGLLPPVCVET